MSEEKSFLITTKNGELIASLIAKGVNADITTTSASEKMSALLIADAFRSITDTTVVSFASSKEKDESNENST